jgi:hypothetical protein
MTQVAHEEMGLRQLQLEVFVAWLEYEQGCLQRNPLLWPTPKQSHERQGERDAVLDARGIAHRWVYVGDAIPAITRNRDNVMSRLQTLPAASRKLRWYLAAVVTKYNEMLSEIAYLGGADYEHLEDLLKTLRA